MCVFLGTKVSISIYLSIYLSRVFFVCIPRCPPPLALCMPLVGGARRLSRLSALLIGSTACQAMTTKAAPSLPALHAALSAPLGRKYSRAQSWRPSGVGGGGPTRIELSFEEPDLIDAKPSKHAVYYDLATEGSGLSLAGPPVQVPVGAELKLSHRSAGGLELRLLPASKLEPRTGSGTARCPELLPAVGSPGSCSARSG